MIIPSLIRPWIPRNFDTFQIIDKLLYKDSRIVQVFGHPGVGKSSLIIKVANYLADRSLYPGGIVYIDLSKIENVKLAFALIIQKIDHTLSFGVQFRKLKSLTALDKKDLFFKLKDSFDGKQKTLLILDNLDDLIIHDRNALIKVFQGL